MGMNARLPVGVRRRGATERSGALPRNLSPLVVVTGPVTDTDADRFETAFEMHQRAVLAYALRRVPTEADAEDAVADTFAVAWRKVRDLPPEAAALPWLLAIARRIVANQRRGTGRRLRLGLRLGAEPPPIANPPTPDSPALDALERVPRADRELLRLLAWEGLSQAEAGIVLGITANAVAIRLHRARRRFADELARAALKGSPPIRTSESVEGRTTVRRNGEERA